MKNLIFEHKNIGFKGNKFGQVAKKVQPYIGWLKHKITLNKYDFDGCFTLLPKDKELVKKVSQMVDKKSSPRLAGVVVVGIGGSNLGTRAIYQALKPKKKILFAETVDPDTQSDILGQVKDAYKEKKHYIFTVVSKSGGTTETLANYGALIDFVRRLDKDWKKRIVFITDSSSKLESYALAKDFDVLPIPKLVGGRYSVMSAVGLFPLMLAGIDIKKLLRGAVLAQKQGLNIDWKNNYALTSAISIYLNWKRGKTIHNTFIFSDKLKYIGGWYRQLVGESLGKEFDLKGRKVNRGITPIISMGSTDLHSVGQLYFGGPQDKFTTFISLKKYDHDYLVSNRHGLKDLVDKIENKSLSQLMKAILLGVKTSYRKRKMPYAEIELSSITEESLGALLQMKMLETVYLARLFKVNAFDQPAVEFYKEETRKILKK